MHLAHSPNGQCVVCHREGRGHRDFICENCGDQGCTMIVCERCGEKQVATPESIELISSYSKLDIPKTAGIVIRLSCCIGCHLPGEPITTTVFTLRMH